MGQELHTSLEGWQGGVRKDASVMGAGEIMATIRKETPEIQEKIIANIGKLKELYGNDKEAFVTALSILSDLHKNVIAQLPLGWKYEDYVDAYDDLLQKVKERMESDEQPSAPETLH